MGLQVFWFVVIAFFWLGFFILEGFVLGVGALHIVVGKTDLERRVAINTIGPFWDGNKLCGSSSPAQAFSSGPMSCRATASSRTQSRSSCHSGRAQLRFGP